MSRRPATAPVASGPEAVHPVHDHVARNRRRSLLIIASFAGGWFVLALVVLGVLLGLLLGWPLLAVVAAVAFAGVITYLAVGGAEARVLRSLAAKPAQRDVHARLFNVVDGLCIANGLPEPTLYVIDDPSVNALATRRNPRTASIVVTTGLLDALDRMPLEGVIAHQLGRIKTDAAGVGTLAAGLIDGPLLRALPGVQASVLLRVTGYHQEASADLDAVAITRYPPGLLAALEACQAHGTVVASAQRTSAHLWLAQPLATEPASDPAVVRNRTYLAYAPLGQRIDLLREL